MRVKKIDKYCREINFYLMLFKTNFKLSHYRKEFLKNNYALL